MVGFEVHPLRVCRASKTRHLLCPLMAPGGIVVLLKNRRNGCKSNPSQVPAPADETRGNGVFEIRQK